MQIDAIILAGGDPDKDAELLAYAGNAPRKALIRLGEKTFLEHIVSAMLDSNRVRRIIVVGLPTQHTMNLGAQVSYIPDAGGLLENGQAGIDYLRGTGHISERVLAASSDIPLITPKIVQDLLALCLPHDVDFCYSIVDKQIMERAFPGSGRTFIPIQSRRFAGGDINVSKSTILDTNKSKLKSIIGERKTFWKQLRAIGLDTVFLFLIRRLTIAQIEHRVNKALGFKGKAIICPYAQVAMDVDKPHHLDIVRDAWARQQRGV